MKLKVKEHRVAMRLLKGLSKDVYEQCLHFAYRHSHRSGRAEQFESNLRYAKEVVYGG